MQQNPDELFCMHSSKIKALISSPNSSILVKSSHISPKEKWIISLSNVTHVKCHRPAVYTKCSSTASDICDILSPLSLCAWNWIRKINFRCYLQLFRLEFKFQKLTDRPNAHLYSCQSSCCWWWYTGQFWGNRGGIWSCVTGAWHPRPWGQKQTKSPLIWRTSQHLV